MVVANDVWSCLKMPVKVVNIDVHHRYLNMYLIFTAEVVSQCASHAIIGLRNSSLRTVFLEASEFLTAYFPVFDVILNEAFWFFVVTGIPDCFERRDSQERSVPETATNVCIGPRTLCHLQVRE